MRTLDLRNEVLSEKVKVNVKNGILEVRLLTTEEAKAKVRID
jgi:HSP20 family molecular chaperone IbpA